MPSTEVATYGLIANANVNDPDNFATKNQRSGFSIVEKQPGFLKYHLGMQIDKTDAPIIEAMIDWEDKAAHMAWRETPEHEGVATLSMSIFTDEHFKGGRMFHVDFAPYDDLAKACAAPVTEVATFYFDGAPPEGCVDNILKFREELSRVVEELWGSEAKERAFAVAGGVSHEVLQYEGVEGLAVVLLIGWNSIEEHIKTRESTQFNERCAPILLPIGLSAKKREMHHTAFKYTRA